MLSVLEQLDGSIRVLPQHLPLLPSVVVAPSQRYQQWITDQQTAGVAFTPDQRKWLNAVKDHIAASLSIEPDDLEDTPFAQMGGLGKAHQLFGERLTASLEELNRRLAA